MSSYIIKGGNKLEGTVKISGSKNSSLPIIAKLIREFQKENNTFIDSDIISDRIKQKYR